MNTYRVRKLVLTAMFAALVAVATMVVHIPMIATRGFINVGDTMIFTAAVLLGPWAGLVAGGVGSALADMLLGYAHWAPWTLVIKGLQGLLVGALAHRYFREKRSVDTALLLALALGAAWMVLGYYLAAGVILDFRVALTEVPGNIMQGVASVALAALLLQLLRHLRGLEKFWH